MMEYKKNKFRENKNFYQSLKLALTGLKLAFKVHLHFKIEVFIGFLVIILSFIFNLNKIEFLFILSAITLVLITEIINSLVEEILDFFYQEYHETIKFIKDLGAGLVLIAVIYSLIIGFIIFLPKIYETFF